MAIAMATVPSLQPPSSHKVSFPPNGHILTPSGGTHPYHMQLLNVRWLYLNILHTVLYRGSPLEIL